MENGIAIKVLCPECRRELNDRFEAQEANILPGEQYFFEFECPHCNHRLRVSVIAEIKGAYW